MPNIQELLSELKAHAQRLVANVDSISDLHDQLEADELLYASTLQNIQDLLAIQPAPAPTNPKHPGEVAQAPRQGSPGVVTPKPENPPNTQPADWIKKDSPLYGVSGNVSKTVNPGFYGENKEASSFCNTLSTIGGYVSSTRFIGTAQSCLGGPMHQVNNPLKLEDCVFSAKQQNGIGKAWLTRGMGQPRSYIGCEFEADQMEGYAEGHVYENGADYWRADYCRFYHLPGNVQITCRSYEAPGLLRDIYINSIWDNCHAPLKNGQKSSMVGGLLNIYNPGPECKAVVYQIIYQDEWPQFGTMITCVPGLAAGETNPWWKVGQHVCDSLTTTVQFQGKRPQAGELYRIAALRELSINGTIEVEDQPSLKSAPCRILLDDPQWYPGHAQLEKGVIDLVTTFNGEPWDCPIEWRGSVVGFTNHGPVTVGTKV